MIEANNLKELISLIPLTLNHVVPGYIFYSIIRHQLGSNINDYKHIIFKSIVFSYGINSILGLLISIGNKLFPILSVSLSIVTAIALINIIEKNWLTNIAFKLNLYKAAKEDLISDIVDSKLGMWLYVYIDGEKVIYLGKLIKYEEITKNGHRYILLSEYTCYSYDGGVLESHDGEHTSCVLINIANVTRIELVYDENSKKIQKAKKESSNA